MNQSEFAKYLGVSQSRVSAYIRKGMLSRSVKKVGKRFEIDPEAAKTELAETMDPTYQDRQKAIESAGTGELSFNRAKTVEKQYMAALRKLEYEEKSKKLIPAEDVERQAFDCARQVRDAFLNFPDRLSAVLAAETEAKRVKELLKTEIRTILENLGGENGI